MGSFAIAFNSLKSKRHSIMLLANSFVIFLECLFIKAIFYGVLWSLKGAYAELPLIKVMAFSLIVGFIWEAPWYLAYFLMFSLTIAFLRKRRKITLGLILVVVIILDFLVSYRMLNDFQILFHLHQVSFSEFYSAQIRGGFRFFALLICSGIYGFLYYKIIEKQE